MQKAFYVYMLRCSDNSLYTGQTDNLDLRIKEHNGELKGGAKYTLSKRPVTLAYFEIYQTRSQAMKRENEIKKMTKAEKEVVILKNNLLIS